MTTDRVVFVQPYLARYREPFYEQLQEQLSRAGMQIEVAVGRVQSGRQDEGAFPVSLWPDRLAPLTADRLRLRLGRLSHSDLVVMEQAVKNLDAWTQLLRWDRKRPGLALWGHGRTYSQTSRTARVLKSAMTKRADWFFAYTQAGAQAVVHGGFPRSRVTVVGNTIDTAALSRDLATVDAAQIDAFRASMGLTAGRTALFLGSVDRTKDIDILIRSTELLRECLPGFVLLVAGHGPAMADLAASPAVRLLGRVDGQEKALALRCADLLTVPGAVGLVAVDSLVAGVPMVYREGEGHGPEVAYLNGQTAMSVPAEAGVRGYAQAVADLLRDESRRRRMGELCRASAAQYAMPNMVSAFRDGLLALREIHEFRL